MVINLGNYKDKVDVKILSGRSRGAQVRKSLNLDLIDLQSEQVTVTIPDDIDSITTSFFLGLFGQSVRSLHSKDNFLNKYEFKCSEEIFKLDILEGIRQALKSSIPF